MIDLTRQREDEFGRLIDDVCAAAVRARDRHMPRRPRASWEEKQKWRRATALKWHKRAKQKAS
ncbi:MAG: hypothetical protein ACRD4R_06830 [Candidatus Acidiferrales bacterium]